MLERTRVRVLVALLTTAGITSAQSGSDQTTVLVRADDDIVLHVDSPQRIRSIFRVTNLGAVLGDERGDELRAGLATALMPTGPGVEATSGLLVRLMDADLALDVGVHLDDSKPDDLHADGVLVLTPGKGLDPAQLAADIEKVVREQGLLVGEIECAGAKYPTVRMAAGEASITLPVVRDGKLVAVFGEDLAASIGRRMATSDVEPWRTTDGEWRTAQLALRVDLHKLARTSFWASGDKERKAQLEASGLDSLDSLRLLVRTAGPNIEIDSRLSFDERGPRGLLAGIFVPVAEPPAFAGLATDDGADWFAGKFDLEAFARAVLKVVAVWSVSSESGDDLEAQIATVRKSGAEFLGCDIERDLGASFARDFFLADAHALLPEVPRLGTTEGDELVDSGFLFLAPARDAKALRTAVERVCASQIGQWIDLEGEADLVDGVEVHGHGDTRVGWREPTFMLATGPHAIGLVQVVAKRDAVARAEKGGKLPAILERVRRRFAPGFQGCGVLDLGSVAGVVLFQVSGLGMFDGELPRAKQWRTLVDSLRGPLHAVDLDRVAITTGYADHAFTLRAHW